MSDLLQFALLGLGAGAAIALLGHGVVVVYRASGIINLAQASFAMAGAYLFVQFKGSGLPTPVAIVLAVLLSAAAGAAIYLLIFRPLRKASSLARLIATLGVLSLIQAVATIAYKDTLTVVQPFLPAGVLRLGDIALPQDRVWLLVTVVVLTVALWLVSRFTLFGHATSAIAENEVSAAALGWSPDRLATINWALACGLAAIAGILIVPLTGLSVSVLTLLIVPALAAALVGGLRSYPLTLVGGLVIGILQSVAGRYIDEIGWPQAIPFLLILVVMVVRGRALPLRSHGLERLAELGSGRIRPVPLIVVLGCVVAGLYLGPSSWATPVAISGVFAVAVLSVVVLTGYAGQLSLAQAALGGIGAVVAARMVLVGWGFEWALLAGVLAAVGSGLVFGIPALRTRGANLAILTLGLGSAVEVVVFHNARFIGDVSGTTVGPQTFLGLPIDGVLNPRGYAVFVLVWLVVCALVVGNLRRSATGRQLIAVRGNERAAAALGISGVSTKLYAFAVSAGLAGLSGILYAFRSWTITYDTYTPLTSISIVMLAVIGGVGYVLGAPIGSVLAVGGIGTIIATAIFGDNQDQWLSLIGAVALLSILIQDPNGLARFNAAIASRLIVPLSLRARVLGERVRRRVPEAEPERVPRQRVPSLALSVRGVTVRFGGVTALQDVDVTVAPGQVVGLIGPNGAGKTTLVDAITGFARPESGEITLGDRSISAMAPHERARLGLSRSFQSLELFEDISVSDNLRAACDTRGSFSWLTDLVAPRTRPLSPVAVAAVEEFGLHDVLDKRPDELPYGQRRLVAIARAVAAGPSVLLLDEPAAGLDEVASTELARLVRKLADESGIGVLVIEHDMSFVMSICDAVTVLDFGRLIASGPPAAIREDPLVKAAYLGGVDADEAVAVAEP